MSTTAARTALLYDTEASLRLVDGELRDSAPRRRGPRPPSTCARCSRRPPGSRWGWPPSVHPRAGERRDPGRARQPARQPHGARAATVEKIQHTSDKLREVTSATEVAATDILDALDRTQAMVDALDAADDAGDRDAGVRCASACATRSSA
jgi:hypothetical protein